MRHSIGPKITDGDKTDLLIRDKLESLATIPGSGHFDKQMAWDRMAHRLQRSTTRKRGWWKYAAAILVLVSGGYGISYLASRPLHPRVSVVSIVSAVQPGSAAGAAPASVPVFQGRPQMPVVLNKRSSAGQNESHLKKGRDKRRLAAVRPGTSVPPEPADREVTLPETGQSAGDAIAAGSGPSKPRVVVTKAAVKIPVAYYNELINPVAEDPARKGFSAKFSIRVHPPEMPQKSLVVNQESLRSPLSLHLSSKN